MAKRSSGSGGKPPDGTKGGTGTPPWDDENEAVAGNDPPPAERDANTNDMFGDVAKEAAAQPASGVAKPYVVLARKYRPRTFEDLIGQEAMVTTLRNAFNSDRIAQAYMLTGVRGVGKTTTARILARALNYAILGQADRPTIDMPELGEHCAAIMESRHPDVLEMDAASNTGIDNVREIIEGARYRPTSARTKVYIIDEVHMLSKGAFNALLKTLEEPPPHVKFIFATTEIRKVPVTVLSRCQRFDLRRVGAEELVAHFRRIAAAEGVPAEPEALALIARAAEGSVRDGLSILDQGIATGSESRGGAKVTAVAVRAMLGLADRARVFDLLETVLQGDAAGALGQLAGLHKDGADPIQLITDLAEAVHLSARAKAAGAASLGETFSEDERQRAASLADGLTMPALARAWQMLLKGLDEAGRAPDTVAAVEMLIIRMAYAADLPTPDEIIRGVAKIGNAGARSPAAEGTGAGGGNQGTRGHAQRAPELPPSARTSIDTQHADYASASQPDAPPKLELESFQDLVDFVGSKRDARLKVLLEEHVSIVRYEPGQIDFFMTDGAPKALPNELREKLNGWTGRKWMIALSKQPGAKTIGQIRSERDAAALAEVMSNPIVQDMLKHFPDAEILSVRPIEGLTVAPGEALAEVEEFESEDKATG